eukprot:CAMPEP_0113305732 /NCGR_PEP_ID=MMETSP0010_2-20120614/5249_1 /TAXON_ID=216773 ORGANISM="Corethron hystrix, Strain 308" /NCGR_SAMPLE_ID=MMETSP0010_2 /ASSEMBLY_ACC=CAM_ASM_000155 /LENGTH=523 /DNA_ID=CAMNT_0000160225 /DNA_START=151 /DNA_END=1722 /DNA_ORIENTATION=+ /assembly_acc=CAM_ASM_000155
MPFPQRKHSMEIDNPTPHVLEAGENAVPLEVSGHTATDKLVIFMVGLPATGKTHIAKRICRYVSFFLDIPAKIFNVGDYRRNLVGVNMPASFYRSDNAEAVAARHKACDAALDDLCVYMSEDGVRVGVYDATNSTTERRNHLRKRLAESGIGTKFMCIESICTDQRLLEENIRTVKLNTPDYRDMDPEVAVADFTARRDAYKEVYETVGDDEKSPFVKVYDMQKFIVNRIRGYLPLKVTHFVMNLHTLPRTIYLSRHGQSEYNVLGKIGGDSGLSKAGIEYARRLAVYAKEEMSIQKTTNDDGTTKEGVVPIRLWTSTLNRTKETTQFFEHPTIRWKFDNNDEADWIQFRHMVKRNLDELYAGGCDGMTYKEIEMKYPEEFGRRQTDKLAYRYPRGESYMDVMLRLEPLAHEMERIREPVLVVGHQGIHRILYAYMMGLSREEAPYVSIPLNTVIELRPHAYGCDEKRVCLMNKQEMSEMLDDGQDEPVTSMPTSMPMAKRGSNSEKKKDFAANDPVMDAPSH